MASLSNALMIVLLVILLCVVATFLVLQNVRPTAIQSLTPKEGTVSKPTSVGNIGQIRTLFFTAPSSTFTVYIYCKALDKTPKVDNKEPTVLFQFGDAVKFVLYPAGASTQSTTRLIIKTQGPTAEIETVEAPPFPLQKWVCLGLVREGRRFTLYYNGLAVSSHRTKYFPVVSSSSLTIGDTKASGGFANPSLVGTALSTSEMKKYAAILSDTRDKPYPNTKSFLSILAPLSFGCPEGLFCFSTSSPPTTNPLVSWKSSYA